MRNLLETKEKSKNDIFYTNFYLILLHSARILEAIVKIMY